MEARASIDIWLRRIPVPTTVSDPEAIPGVPFTGPEQVCPGRYGITRGARPDLAWTRRLNPSASGQGHGPAAGPTPSACGRRTGSTLAALSACGRTSPHQLAAWTTAGICSAL